MIPPSTSLIRDMNRSVRLQHFPIYLIHFVRRFSGKIEAKREKT